MSGPRRGTRAKSGATPARMHALERLLRIADPRARRADPFLADPFQPDPAFDTPEADALPEDRPPRRERDLAERIVRGTLQRRGTIDALLAAAATLDAKRTDPALLWILRIAIHSRLFLESVPDAVLVHQAVEMARAALPRARSAPAFVNAVLRRALPTLPNGPAETRALLSGDAGRRLPPEARHSIPRAILEALADGYAERPGGGPDLERHSAMFDAMNREETSVWLRVVRIRTTAERAIADLALEGVRVEPAPGFERDPEGALALRWIPAEADPAATDAKPGAESDPRAAPPAPWRTAPWRRGELVVQDLAAMLPVILLDPRAGERVLDYCAAPGGKTGQAWEAMRGRGRLVALEVSPARREVLRETLRRIHPEALVESGAPDAHDGREGIVVAEGEDDPALAGRFDAVLVDAPCLALGLLRRHPEARWDGRLGGEREIVARQGAILRAAADRVAEGGRLAWATCSPTRDENEGVVLEFLSGNPGFRVVDPAPRLAGRAFPRTVVREGFVRTIPDELDGDGFCMVLLERAGRSDRSGERDQAGVGDPASERRSSSR